MIVVLSKFGRFGNRLTINIHALSVALQTRQNFISLFGNEIIKMTGRNRFVFKETTIRFLPFNAGAFVFRQMDKIYFAYKIILQRIHHNANIETSFNQNIVKKHRIHVVSNWYARDASATAEMAPTIRAILAFAPWHRKASDKYFLNVTTNLQDTVFVGVHIRRTDYRDFMGGRYFWSHETYLRIMNSFAKQMKGRHVCFVIVSDEPIPNELFKSPHFETRIFHGNKYEDMCALSRCEYVMGPPSTFSRSAAFIGGCLYKAILDPNDTVSISSFSPPI